MDRREASSTKTRSTGSYFSHIRSDRLPAGHIGVVVMVDVAVELSVVVGVVAGVVVHVLVSVVLVPVLVPVEVGVLVAVGIVLSLTGATDCVVSPTASGEAPLACQRDANLQPTSLQTDAALDLHILDKLMPECNTCSAWDGMCDESDPSAENGDGLCPPGTDAYDCIVADQTRRAIYEASSYVAPLGGMDAVFLFVGFGWFALAPVVLSCAYLCPVKKCASCKFDAIPM